MKPHYRDFFLYILLILTACIGVVFIFSKNNLTQPESMTNEASSSSRIKTYSSPPPQVLDPKRKYKALLTTSKGKIDIELFANETPKTVNNFVFLAKEGFYNNTIFHRVMKGFMIQGGDPKGDGTGGPGYKFEDEKITRDYKRGIVAMANSGPNTNGSQFFITDKATPWLDGRHSVFGRVTEGLEVVHLIARVERDHNDKPLTDVVIKKIVIERQ